MQGYTVEPAFKVYDDSEGVCIEFRESPDFPGIIMMHTPDKESKVFYGEINLTMSIEHAKAVKDALTKQIEAMEK